MRASRKSPPRHPRAGSDLPLSRCGEISAAKLSLFPARPWPARSYFGSAATRAGGCSSRGWLPVGGVSALGEFRELV